MVFQWRFQYLKVNDLAINYRQLKIRHYRLETIRKDDQSNLQSVIHETDQWCTENDMVLNHCKCKDLLISFAKDTPNLGPLFIKQ